MVPVLDKHPSRRASFKEMMAVYAVDCRSSPRGLHDTLAIADGLMDLTEEPLATKQMTAVTVKAVDV